MARWRSTGREASSPPPGPGGRRATGPPARRHIHAGHHRSPRSALPLAPVLPGSMQRLTWPLTPSLRKHVRGVTPNPTTNRDRPTRARFAPTADLCAPASQDQTWLLQPDLPIRHGPESVAPNPRAAPDRAIRRVGARLSSGPRVVGGPIIAQCTIGSTACLCSADLGMNVRSMPQIACAATRICSDPLPCYSRLINSRPCQLNDGS